MMSSECIKGNIRIPHKYFGQDKAKQLIKKPVFDSFCETIFASPIPPNEGFSQHQEAMSVFKDFKLQNQGFAGS